MEQNLNKELTKYKYREEIHKIDCKCINLNKK